MNNVVAPDTDTAAIGELPLALSPLVLLLLLPAHLPSARSQSDEVMVLVLRVSLKSLALSPFVIDSKLPPTEGPDPKKKKTLVVNS